MLVKTNEEITMYLIQLTDNTLNQQAAKFLAVPFKPLIHARLIDACLIWMHCVAFVLVCSFCKHILLTIIELYKAFIFTYLRC